jgi:hypothetical protein
MKRVFMLLAVALMAVAAMALSGVAQADSPRDDCREKAQSLTGSTLAGYTFVVGTADRNIFTSTDGRNAPTEVFCGFDGGDHVSHLKGRDIFIGGKGTDSVEYNSGRFYGGDGDDSVFTNFGTFNGGAGGDSVAAHFGTFNGGAGGDSVDANLGYGDFNGGVGVDYIVEMFGGTFDGGDDTDDDYVVDYYAGRLVNVP